jgi:hypothetical protein
MQTLLDKWNYYNDIIKFREKEYVEKTIKHIPEYVYEIWGINGNIKELQITEVIYNNRKYFPFNTKPTKKDVEKIRLFAETPYEFSTENIIFNYRNGSSLGGFSFKNIGKYMTKEQAEEAVRPIVEKYKADELLINNGTHTRCERCRNVVENSSVVHYKIVSIATYGHSGRNGKFCSGACAGHEQMAHEG